MHPANVERVAWVRATVLLDTDECVEWPWAVDASTGYPRLTIDGVERHLHVHVLLLTGRTPPARGEGETRHTCGRKRCANRRHVIVGTQRENTDDRLRLGEVPSGERHYRARLTDADVAAIRSDGRRQTDIAAAFGISQSHVSKIRSGHARS